MLQEVKKYLLSVKDRTIGSQWARDGYQSVLDNNFHYNDSRVAKNRAKVGRAFFRGAQILLPLTTEWFEESLGRLTEVEMRRDTPLKEALANPLIMCPAMLLSMGADTAGVSVTLILSANNIAEGALFKAGVNAGSHILVDAIRYGVNRPHNFRGSPLALV